MAVNSAMKAVDALLLSGCHPSKVVLGLPAYGRHKRHPSQVKTYSELVDVYIEQSSMTRSGNDEKDTSLEMDLKHTKEHSGYTIESHSLVLEKVQRLVVDRHLSGVFLWEMGQDYRGGAFREGMLLRYVHDAFAFHGQQSGQDDRDEL